VFKFFHAQVGNEAKIPYEGLAMIRYHSAYPWHSYGAYRHLMTEKDEDMMKHVLDFNQFDLYTKDDDDILSPSDIDELWSYYQPIIDKYIPGDGGKLKW
jgi:inositol oxygenase